MIYADFARLHEQSCKGVDKAGETDSDFELWTPYDGRHGNTKCFLGQTVTYVRRKPDKQCFNGENFETVIRR